MNNKIILIIVGSVVISLFATYLILDYNFTYEQNKSIQESSFVKNCIPGGPDKIIPAIKLENSTHEFNLGNCEWYEKNK